MHWFLFLRSLKTLGRRARRGGLPERGNENALVGKGRLGGVGHGGGHGGGR